MLMSWLWMGVIWTWKLWTPRLRWASVVGKHIHVLGGWLILIPWDAPSPHPMCLFIWLVGICIPCNKTVIISIALSGVLWVILTNYQACHGNIQIYSQSVKSIGGLRNPEAQLALEVRTALPRTESLTSGSIVTAGGNPRIELQEPVRVGTEYLYRLWVNTRVSRVEVQTWCHRKMIFGELIS